MVDVHSPSQRKRNMQAIRGSHTKPELRMRKLLHAAGLRYKLHDKNLPGRPDMVFPKYKAVIFVHGCFWHGHACHLFKLPATREEFWIAKLLENKERDHRVDAGLKNMGWRVLRVWECAMRGKLRLADDALKRRVIAWLESLSEEGDIAEDAK